MCRRDPAQHLLPVAADAVLDLEVVELEGVGGGGRSGGGHRSNDLLMPSAIMFTAITSEAMASAGNRTGHQ